MKRSRFSKELIIGVMHVHNGKNSFAAFRTIMEICAILVQDNIREIKAR